MCKSVYIDMSVGQKFKHIKIISFTTTQISYKQSRESMLFSKTKKLINGFFSKLSLHYIYLD